MINPILALFEWTDEVLGGQSAPRMCQWRSAIVPSQPLTLSGGLSPLLAASHVRKADDDEDDDEEKGKSVAAAVGADRFLEPFALELADGSLVSFLHVRGTRTNMRELDVAKRSTEIGKRLAKSFLTNQHSYGVHFLHDPMSAASLFDQKIEPMRATAQRLGGDASEMIADQKSRIIKGAAEEMMLMSIRTHPAGLRQDERKRMRDDYGDLVKSIEKTARVNGRPLALATPYGQSMLSKSLPILKRHESLVVSTLTALSDRNIDIAANLLSTREALQQVRRFADRETAMSVSLPVLNGQPGSLAHPGSYADSFAPLALGMQVLRRKIIGHIDSVELSQIGTMYYGTAVMTQGCASPRHDPTSTLFNEFLQKVRSQGIPIAVSFDLLPRGLKFNGLNRTLNGILGSVGSHNRQIKAAYTALKEYEEGNANSDPVIGLRLHLTTWAKKRDAAERALNEMVFAAQSWGGMDVNADLGAPDRARLSSIPEFSSTSRAPVVPAPLQDALYITPLTRPTSPWDEGQMVLKSIDGVIYPFALGSSLQASFVSGFCAPSGSGKSVFLNRLHSCLALSPGMSQLPFITNIDVAPSGLGTLRYLRTVLPKSMHHLLVYFKVLNAAENCVNPFDLQLGCWQPTEMAKDLITAVLEIVFDGLGAESKRLIAALIQEVFRFYSPTSPTAAKWQSAYDARVSAALDSIGFKVLQTTTAWDVTDALFDAGMIDIATIAQRYAMPTLSNLPEIVMGERISATFATAKAPGGESIQNYANRALLSAVGQYPVLASHTRIDLDQARVKCIDLQAVVSSSSGSGVQFAGMMYLYARQLGAGNYFLDVAEMNQIARPKYLSYQIKRVREIQATPKVLSYDEWHYVRNLPGFVALNEAECRTTRKFRIYLNFVTQYADDFPPSILDGMTTLMVVGAASAKQNRELAETLGLSNTDLNILNHGLDAVGKIFAWFKLRDGNVTTLLQNDVGPLEMWCYTTDDKDGPLRNELSALIGEGPALRLLSKTFPNGRATAYLDKKAREMGGESQDNDEIKTVAALVARELAAAYNTRMEA